MYEWEISKNQKLLMATFKLKHFLLCVIMFVYWILGFWSGIDCHAMRCKSKEKAEERNICLKFSHMFLITKRCITNNNIFSLSHISEHCCQLGLASQWHFRAFLQSRWLSLGAFLPPEPLLSSCYEQGCDLQWRESPRPSLFSPRFVFCGVLENSLTALTTLFFSILCILECKVHPTLWE